MLDTVKLDFRTAILGKKKLNIDLCDDTLTLTGAVAPFEGPEESKIQVRCVYVLG